VQEKPKVMRGMDEVADCEAPKAFYRVKEGGEMVLWRKNGCRRVKFFNTSVSGRREEGTAPISKGERSTRGGSWFSRGGCSGGQPESSDV
jgi:hypothetical protein